MREIKILQVFTKFRTQLFRVEWLDLLFLTLILGVFYTLWIGHYPLFTPDEGRYSEVAREMLVSGDFITPRLNGIVFLDKPILYYWLQASAIHWFGLSEWALRFWPAIFGILGCLVTYLAGWVLFDRRAALLSTIILATSPLYFGGAHYANLDLEVASLISCSLLFFIMGIKTQSQRLGTFFLWTAYAFSGLAFLTKGFIGFIFPAMIIGSWIIIEWRWDVLKKMRLFSGLIIFAAIALPWYALVQYRNPEFFHFFFVTQQITRFLSTAEFNNKTSWWFYFPIVLLGFLPWAAFIIQALVHNLREAWLNYREHSPKLFLLLWLVLVFTFFSIPHSKTIGYILPIYPALALLMGSYFSKLWEQQKHLGFNIGLIICILLCLTLAVVFLTARYTKLIDLPQEANLYMLAAAGIFLSSSLLLTISAGRKSIPQIFIVMTGSISLFLLLLVASAASINNNTTKPLALRLTPILQPGTEVFTYNRYYQDLPLYLGKYVNIVADWNDPTIERNDNWQRELWYGMDFRGSKAGKHRLVQVADFWQQWFSNQRVVVLLSNRYLQEFEVKSKNQFHKLDQWHDMLVLSNK